MMDKIYFIVIGVEKGSNINNTYTSLILLLLIVVVVVVEKKISLLYH